MRFPLTDGFNSFVHIILGMTHCCEIATLFTLYQIITDFGTNPNFYIDMTEFIIGWFYRVFIML